MGGQLNEIHRIETNIAKTETQKQVHKEDAFKARIERCKSVWKKIAELEQKVSLSEADTDQLEALKHQFTLVISADYQQATKVSPVVQCLFHVPFYKSFLIGKSI